MADPTARTLRLLELLQSAHTRRVGELAEALGVDERTVRRDVARLVALGVPVDSLRGRYGGYRLATGRRVLPLMFSSDEAVAVHLGLTHAQAGSGEPSVAAQTALAKVTRALPPADAERVAVALGAITDDATTDGATTRGAEEPEAGPDPGIVLTIAEAVGRRHPLVLRYRSGEGIPSRRTVHPYALVTHEHRWYLLALDTGKDAERTFRVDRIGSARPAPGTFVPPPRDDWASFLAERFADADYRWHVVLRVRATEAHLRKHLPPSVARLRRLDDADDGEDGRPPWFRAEIRAHELDWLPPVVAALDCEVVVEQPDELRDRLRAAAARLSDAAGGAGAMRPRPPA